MKKNKPKLEDGSLDWQTLLKRNAMNMFGNLNKEYKDWLKELTKLEREGVEIINIEENTGRLTYSFNLPDFDGKYFDDNREQIFLMMIEISCQGAEVVYKKKRDGFDVRHSG